MPVRKPGGRKRNHEGSDLLLTSLPLSECRSFSASSNSSTNDVSVIVTGYDPDSIWGYEVDLYLINNTDQELMYSVSDASVNGYMVDPFYASSLSPGKSKFSSMHWSDSKLEENGIEEIDEIEFTLRIYDVNHILDGDVYKEMITLNP